MNEAQSYINNVVKTITTTILSGQTNSPIIDLSGATLKTIITPSAFDGTELTFKISDDGINFYDYYNVNDLPVTITCSPNRAYGVAAIDFYSIQYLKIVSNVSETANRTIKLITRGV